MTNIDAINKDNIIHEPFEHMIIDNFVDSEFIKSSYEGFKKSHKVLDKFDEFSILYSHPVIDILEEYKQQIIDKVNEVWDLNIITISMSISMFDKTSKLEPHNDYNYDGNFSIPARGILYLNKEKVFGTNIHERGSLALYQSGKDLGPGKEIGGHPGQLFLFKVDENSFHSAGIDIKDDFRICCNWLLNREGSPHQ